jgi:DNA repair protein RadC
LVLRLASTITEAPRDARPRERRFASIAPALSDVELLVAELRRPAWDLGA